MNIDNINSSTNFGSLHIKKVAPEHKHFIDKDIAELKKLGEQYDIYLKSVINSEVRCNGIEIVVKILTNKFNFFQKFYRPKVENYFYTEPHFDKKTEDTTLLEKIKKSVEVLKFLK